MSGTKLVIQAEGLGTMIDMMFMMIYGVAFTKDMTIAVMVMGVVETIIVMLVLIMNGMAPRLEWMKDIVLVKEHLLKTLSR